MFQPPQSLVDAVRQQTLVPFIGAGISVGAVHKLAEDKRFPNWEGLIRRLAARLAAEQKPLEATQVTDALPDTMAAAQLAADSLGRPFFLDEMTKAFGRARAPVGADLTATHAIWKLRSPFLITTNYDFVLEWPWDPLEIRRIHNDDPTYLGTLGQTQSALRRIWYLHGSIGRLDTIILTSNQYEKLYPNANDPKRVDYQNAFNQLQNLLSTKPLLFLGFSLTEPVLRRKLQDVLELTAYAAPIKFLLLNAGEADETKKRDLLNTYSVQVIEFAGFDALTDAIHQIGRTAWGDSPAPTVGLTPDMRLLIDDLSRRLDGLSLPPAAVARIYNGAKPAAWAHALTGGDGIALLRNAIALLGAALSPGDDGPPPLLDFANRLKSDVGEPWLSRLQLWLDDATRRLAPEATIRGRWAQQLATPPSSLAPQRVHVLVRIQPLTGASDEWRVHAWAWLGLRVPESLFGAEGRTFRKGSSEDVVYNLVDELEARSVDPEVTSIAFVVPSSLACEAIHEWRLAASVANDPPLGVSYTVTVRPLERLERAPLVRRRFKRAWDDVKSRFAEMLAILDASTGAAAGVPAIFLDTATAMKPDLARTLESQGVRCVVLRDPPCPTGLGHLSAVLETPTPAILWHRHPGVPPADTEHAIRTLLQAGPVADLPRRLRAARSAAFGDTSGTHQGMSLTLIWDDADYAPPEHDADARARLETT